MTKIILELGGGIHRLNEAINVYQQHPDACILVSSEYHTELCVQMLQAASVPETNYVFDFNAWDTVTNFTKTYRYIMARNARTIFVVTDRFHMRRAMAIAHIVYLFTGIKLVPCESLEGDLNRTESNSLVLISALHAALWKLFGYTLRDATYHERIGGINAEKERAKMIAPVT